MAFLYGPVFTQDFLHTLRRSRVFQLRGTYLLMLLIALGVVYHDWFPHVGPLESLQRRAVAPEQVARLAGAFAEALLIVQFLAAFLFAPSLSATAISEERERGTLIHLLTSPLSSTEIIVGKWASRVAYLLLFLLAGLPIFGLLQLLGGVDPRFVLFAFGLTACNMAGLAALGIVCSVGASTSAGALTRAYVLVVLYYVFTSPALCCGMAFTGAQSPYGYFPWAQLGNLIWVHYRLDAALTAGTLQTELLPLLAGVAAFHMCLVFGCCCFAATKLRPRILRQPRLRSPINLWPPPIESPPLPLRLALLGLGRPRVSNRPVLWKERFCNRDSGLDWLIQYIYVVLGGLTLFYLLIFFGIALIQDDEKTWSGLREVTSELALTGGAITTWFLLVFLGVSVAGTVSRERQQRTLDCLLTTPLDRGTILWQKWLGALSRVDGLIFVLLGSWLLALLCRGMEGIDFVVSIVLVVTLVLFYSAVAMWLSCYSRSVLRARLWVLTALLLHTGLPLLLQEPAFSLPVAVYHAAGISRSLKEHDVEAILITVIAMWLATTYLAIRIEMGFVRRKRKVT